MLDFNAKGEIQMLDKEKLLNDLIELMEYDNIRKDNADGERMKDLYAGSYMTLSTVIDFIKRGKYDIT